MSAVWPIKGGFALLCDCGTLTRVQVKFQGPDGADLPPPHGNVTLPEQAIACDCCGSVHWLTIGPSGAVAAS